MGRYQQGARRGLNAVSSDFKAKTYLPSYLVDESVRIILLSAAEGSEAKHFDFRKVKTIDFHPVKDQN
jgi:hypothetical protein